MKKLVSLILALTLALSGLSALADVRRPEPEITREALRDSFLQNLSELLAGMDPNGKAVRLAVTSGNAALGQALLQSAENTVDLTVSVGDTDYTLQTDDEAVYLALPGQVYKLRFSQVEPILKAALGALTGGFDEFDPSLLSDAAGLFAADVLIPFIKMDYAEGRTHVSVSLDGESLAAALIRFGDDLTKDARMMTLLERIVGILAASGEIDGSVSPQALWPQLREALAASPLPFSLTADLTMEGQTARLEVALTAEDTPVLSLTADLDQSSGVCAIHMETGDGVATDITAQPMENGWSAVMVNSRDGAAFQRATFTATDTDAAFNATLDILYGEDGAILTAAFDKATGALDAALTDRAGEAQATLTGRIIDKGYRLELALLKISEPTTARLDLTADGGVYALDCVLFPGVELGDQRIELALALEEASGAYTMDFVSTPGNRRVSAEGTLNDQMITCHASVFNRDREVTRYDFNLRAPDETLRLSFDQYAPITYTPNPDGAFPLSKVVSLRFTANNETGVFHLGFENRRTSYKFNCEGVLTDEAFHLNASAHERGYLAGTLEITGVMGYESFDGGFTYTEGRMSVIGHAQVTPGRLSLSFSQDGEQFFLLLTTDDEGMPTALRARGDTNGHMMFALSLDEEGLSYEDLRSKYTAAGTFLSDRVWQLDLTTRQLGREQTASLTCELGEDNIACTAVDERGDELFTAVMSAQEQTAFPRLAEAENTIEITPELVRAWAEQLLAQLRSAGE